MQMRMDNFVNYRRWNEGYAGWVWVLVSAIHGDKVRTVSPDSRRIEPNLWSRLTLHSLVPLVQSRRPNIPGSATMASNLLASRSKHALQAEIPFISPQEVSRVKVYPSLDRHRQKANRKEIG